MTDEQTKLLNEIADSLPDVIDVTRGLQGDGKENVITSLNLIQDQVHMLLS